MSKACESCPVWNGKFASPFCEDFAAPIARNADGYMRRVFDCLQADKPTKTRTHALKDMRT